MDVKNAPTLTHTVFLFFCFIYRDDERQIIESIKKTKNNNYVLCFQTGISNFTLVWAAEFKEQSPRAI